MSLSFSLWSFEARKALNTQSKRTILQDLESMYILCIILPDYIISWRNIFKSLHEDHTRKYNNIINITVLMNTGPQFNFKKKSIQVFKKVESGILNDT